MGLAPYGQPVFYNLLRDELIDVKPDGSFRLNLDHFAFHRGAVMTGASFSRLFSGPPRTPEAPITRREMDMAASVQKVLEEAVLLLAMEVKKISGEKRLTLAGGVALNCVANGKLLSSGIFDAMWIQPAAGDAGGALGAALYAAHARYGCPRNISPGKDGQKGSLLGPSYTDEDIGALLDGFQPAVG